MVNRYEMTRTGAQSKFQSPIFHARGGMKLTHELVHDMKLDIGEKETLCQKQVISEKCDKT